MATQPGCQYTIRIRGRLGATALSAFPTMRSEVQRGETALTGVLEDGSAVYGLLTQVEALGLEVLELRRVGPPTVSEPQAARATHREKEEHMESPIELVRRFCGAWSNDMAAGDLAAFLTDDAVYDNIPMAPVTGRDEIAKNIASVIRPGPPGIMSIDFRVINIAANGPVVMTERVDVFTLPDRSFELQVMGTFEVSDGRISAWRDYFDLGQFTSKMSSAQGPTV